MTTASTWYSVYKIKTKLSFADPDMPQPRYHTSIFIQTEHHHHRHDHGNHVNGHGSGTKHHVTGDLVSGMHYESVVLDHDPMTLENFHSKELIGCIDSTTHLERLDDFLEKIPAPHKQKAFNLQTHKTEPVKSWDPLTFYGPGEERRPLVKCTEWIEDRAIPALLASGLIVQNTSDESSVV